MKVLTDEDYMQLLAYKKCALEGHIWKSINEKICEVCGREV